MEGTKGEVIICLTTYKDRIVYFEEKKKKEKYNPTYNK